MGYSVFCQQEKITIASASSSKYPNAVAKERAAMRNFKMLRVNSDAGLGYSSVLWSYLRDSHSTWLELHFFSASTKIKGDFFLPSLHQLAVLPRTISSLPRTPMCSLVLRSMGEKKLSRTTKFKVSIYLQAPLKSKSAESYKVSLRHYHHILALFISLFF